MSDSKASSQFLTKALNGEDIVLKSKGEQLFSYTYVAETARAMLYVLLHGEQGLAYNISNDNCNVHLKGFCTLLCRMGWQRGGFRTAFRNGTKRVFCCHARHP